MVEGLIGRKLGMTQVFREDGVVVPVTAIEVGPCYVTQVKTKDKDGYEAVQVGFGEAKRLNKPERGHLKAVDKLFRHLSEFRGADVATLQVGAKLDVSVFKAGDLVNVVGTSKGRGFAGNVKRHHFKGGPHTHGQSDRERRPGAIGSTTQPGHVLKGLRMAGHMGDARVTVQNLEVVLADPAKDLLLVRGAVPGHTQALVRVYKSRRVRKVAVPPPTKGKTPARAEAKAVAKESPAKAAPAPAKDTKAEEKKAS